MKITSIAAGLLLLGATASASAQTVPDDVHCFVLSNIFARAAKDDKARGLAASAQTFYLGRFDGRIDARSLANDLRTRPDPKLAGPQMDACAKRFIQAEQMIQDIAKSIAPPPGAAKPAAH